MDRLIFKLSLMLACAYANVALPRDDYTQARNQILEYERQLMFGGNVTLNEVEEAANAVLMEAKNSELQAAFTNPGQFPPSRNFLESKNDIENSEVFKIIRKLPKGAVLHSHDTAIVSGDYLYHNVTFRDNLYVCDVNGTLRLFFFDQPNDECNWELLQKVRKDPARAADINKRIMSQMTMAVDNPRTVYTDVDKTWKKFMDIFGFITPMLTYKPVYEEHFYRGLQELYDDNVLYIELRSTLPQLYDLNGMEYTQLDVAQIYKEMTERFKRDHPDFIGVKLIYAPLRFASHNTAREYLATMVKLRKMFPEFVVGFDLVGQEDKGRTLHYFAKILKEFDPKVNFFFHAGETNWNGMSTDENLVDALMLRTRRIGHGYGLAFHPFLLEVAKRMNIAIEICPISNQVLSLVGDMRNHAGKRLFTENYPVVISNDDPGLWGAKGLSYDFYEAFMGLMSAHSDLRALKQLALNSLNYSSLTNEEKRSALAMWQSKWNDFVKNLAERNY